MNCDYCNHKLIFEGEREQGFVGFVAVFVCPYCGRLHEVPVAVA